MRINLKTRRVEFDTAIRDEFAIIRSDNGVSQLVFEVPEELTDWTWSVIYENALGDRYIYTDSVQDGLFVWEIHSTVTEESGRVTFTLQATKDKQQWMSEQQTFYVKKSLADGSNVSDHTYNDVVALVEQAEQAKTAAQTAKDAAEAAQTAAENVRISFTATATETPQGAVIEVTDQHGTTTAEILNGEDGEDGEPGEDGHSVDVTSSKSGSTTTVTFLDKVTGETLDTIRIEDGERGIQGEAGPQGSTGPQGPKGDTGDRGPQGIPGETGPKGDTGSAGPKGDTGSTGPQGPKGDTGNDGVSPTVSTTAITGGTRVSITDATGTHTFDIMDGATGPQGPKGDTGSTGPQGEAGPKGDTGSAGPQGEAGPKGDTGNAGPKGDTGDSITATATKSGTTTTITFSNARTGTVITTATIEDGEQGPKGDTGSAGPKGDTGSTGPQGPKGDTGSTGPKGDTGNDGVSPTISTAPITGGTRITITDATTTQSFDVLNGATGQTGPQGPAGTTPTRGTDYWTAADIAAIESDLQTWCQNTILGASS